MHHRLLVRRLAPADMDRVLEIERASFGAAAYDRNLFAGFFHTCGDLFLGVGGKRAISGYMITCTRGGQAEIVSLAVDPQARGRGAASALMKSTLRRLGRRGVARVRLMDKLDNPEARALYQKFRFEKVRIVRQYYEDGSDALLMARPVRSPGQPPGRRIG